VNLSYWAVDRPVSRLAESDLKPGDVLLFCNLAAKPHRLIISYATQSPYTHAAIFLGDGQIAHAVTAGGVNIEQLVVDAGSYIGVLRSQLGFTADRVQDVRDFIDLLIARKAKYDWSGAISLHPIYKKYFAKIVNNFTSGNAAISSLDELSQRDHFCSALIVACWFVSGMLHNSTWGVYKPDSLSPGDLHRDVTFGWVLGYLIADGVNVPNNDPLQSLTQWADIHQIEKEEAAAQDNAANNSSRASC
jgi:hypothetical protein